MAKTIHECDKAPVLAVLQKQVEDLDHVINGNGKKGLRDEMIVLTEVTSALRTDVLDFRHVVSGIKDYMIGLEAEKREVEKRNNGYKWAMGVLLTILLFLFGTGILGKKTVITQPINNRSLTPEGKPYDSIWWNDKDNPAPEIEIL